MKIRLTAGQIDIVCGFLANMAVAWLVAAFISPRSFLYFLAYLLFGVVSLYASMYLKGGRYEF